MFLIFSVSRHESGVTSSVKFAHNVKLQSIISSNEQVRRIPYENFRNIVLNGLDSISTTIETLKFILRSNPWLTRLVRTFKFRNFEPSTPDGSGINDQFSLARIEIESWIRQIVRHTLLKLWNSILQWKVQQTQLQVKRSFDIFSKKTEAPIIFQIFKFETKICVGESIKMLHFDLANSLTDMKFKC